MKDKNIDDVKFPRSIQFRKKLWDAIDEDAKLCNRSAIKQMEVILEMYYGLRPRLEVDGDRLKDIRKTA